MAKRPTRTLKLFLASSLFVLTVGFAGIFSSETTVSAAACTPTRVSCNADETRAYNECFSAANPGRIVQGAIWLNNSGGAATTDGYYALGVNVSATQEYVDVFVRGSFYGCGNGAGAYSGIWAVNTRSDNRGGTLPQSYRLTIPGSVLYRGSYVGSAYRWSSQGSSLAARLDVRGLATNNQNGPASQTITVGIHRCFSSNGATVGGTCDVSAIPVTVTRAMSPYYTLTPSVSVNPAGTVEVDAPITVTSSVAKQGGAAANNITWLLMKFIVPPGGSYPTGQTNNQTGPGTHYGNGASSIAGTARNFTNASTSLGGVSQTADDVQAGSRICYALSLRPYTNTNTNNDWRHSAPRCVVVGKKPKVHVLSGDLQVGRAQANGSARISDVTTSTTTKGGSTFGSWAEYAIVPSGCVTGMASGSGRATTGVAAGTTLESLSLLTFTVPGRTINEASPPKTCAIGSYTQANLSPDVAARFPISVPVSAATGDRPASPAPLSSTTVSINSLASGAYQAPLNATALAVSGGGPIGAGRSGQWVVINAPAATVTITDNIEYTTESLESMAHIPQVVIIARNIIIADNVSQVDAWLVAVGQDEVNGSGTVTARHGNVNTCGAGAVTQDNALTYRECGTQLTVNGPVIANHLIMRRTHGSEQGAQSAVPAEIFNLRADAYIWATAYNLNTGRLSTVNTKELPPRF